MMVGLLRLGARPSAKPGRFAARGAALALAAAVVGLAGLAGPASAQSCNALRAELARLESGGAAGEASQAARYDRAWREQAAVLARTRDEARRADCFGGSFLFFRSRPQPVCRTLIPKLEQMEDNLVRLEHLRDRHARGAGDARRMEQIRAILERGACSDGGGFFARLFGSGEPPREDFRRPPRYGDSWRDEGGPYRTLCVRSCDGYYFPISFSTTRERFATDRRICQAMCPGMEVELYYHPDPTADPENMMSVVGQPYAQLPNAFRYRKELDPSCSCGKPEGPQMSLATNGLAAAEEALGRQAEAPAGADTAPLPRPRGVPAEDPETRANRAGGYLPRTAAADATVADGAGRPVRIVGPAYWGDRQADDVLITPLPN